MLKAILNKKIELILALLFILTGIAFRLIEHAPNFTPIAALALFGAVYLSRRLALIVPLLAMFVSDIFIGFYAPTIMLVVYASFALTVILGLWLKKHKSWQNILFSSLLAGVIFFILTNFAVWLFSPWYAKTLVGLIQCYTLALPFFRNTLLGNVFYATVFFSCYEIALAVVKQRVKAKV